MKKKIVVQMAPLDSQENRRKAMKLSVKVTGVASVSVDRDKGQITITGEDVDPVAVAKALKGGKLRKFLDCLWPYHRVGPVNLVTVEDVKPEEEKPEEKKAAKMWVGNPYCYSGPPVIQVVEGAQHGEWRW